MLRKSCYLQVDLISSLWSPIGPRNDDWRNAVETCSISKKTKSLSCGEFRLPGTSLTASVSATKSSFIDLAKRLIYWSAAWRRKTSKLFFCLEIDFINFLEVVLSRKSWFRAVLQRQRHDTCGNTARGQTHVTLLLLPQKTAVTHLWPQTQQKSHWALRRAAILLVRSHSVTAE